MKLSKILKLVLIISITITTTGCWGARELNDLSIATGMAIDKKQDGYELTVQVVLPSKTDSKGGGEGRTPVVTFHTTAKTLWEAGRKLIQDSSRQIYAGHLRILVLGEEVAKEGIEKVIDLFFRFQEMRSDILVLVAKEKRGSDILKVLTAMEKNPTMHLYNSIQRAEKLWAPTEAVELSDLISNSSMSGGGQVLTVVELKGPLSKGIASSNLKKIVPPTKLRIDGLAALKNGRLVGYLNENESQGFSFITDNVTRTIGHVKCKNGRIAMEIFKSRSDVKGDYIEGKPRINIKVETEASIGEVDCDINLTDPNNIAELENKAEEEIKSRMRAALHKAQTVLTTDIFGFGEKIRRSNPKEWRKLKRNWEKQYPSLTVDMEVKVKIKDTRVITNPVFKGNQK
ncbi:Ger(x)C family spore germination protein [Shimazuella alba]|uniref:Ger(X)C family spore germination protein n=1 Tax=Shimazuella alba TaxID=2690964 RepID=A0A6I4VT78_9BACL|nr:Ger(x)C family spore germination protein [Shimazuella alba]MXQ53688.1 Ger(x)C family spore germination protein [Shimazuella alba]